MQYLHGVLDKDQVPQEDLSPRSFKGHLWFQSCWWSAGAWPPVLGGVDDVTEAFVDTSGCQAVHLCGTPLQDHRRVRQGEELPPMQVAAKLIADSAQDGLQALLPALCTPYLSALVWAQRGCYPGLAPTQGSWCQVPSQQGPGPSFSTLHLQAKVGPSASLFFQVLLPWGRGASQMA